MSRTLALLLTIGVASALSGQAAPTKPVANGRSPVVSPDGQHLLFTSDRVDAPGLYLTTDDGSVTKRVLDTATAGGRVVWRGDGRSFLLSRIVSDTIHAFSIRLDDLRMAELGKVSAPGAKSAALSANASDIVYGGGPWESMQLFHGTVGSEGSSRITPGDGAYWCHAISRDGRCVAVNRRDKDGTMQVWVMGLDGGAARQVTHFPREDGSPQCAAWSAEGNKLAVQAEVPYAADTTKGIGTIWVVDVATGRSVKLGAHAAPYLDELPSWVPDGRRIAFQSDRTGRWEIWVMNVDGSGARQLTGP